MDDPGEADNESSRKPVSRPGPTRSRPRAGDLFSAVVEMVSSGAAAFKGTARRYSICSADAEDAYQRGLEILMTKAPTASRAELQPWLHTVIKHEALALRRQRERLLGSDPTPPGEISVESVPSPAEGVAQRERLRQTAEALGELKSSEIQCLLLKALGYSYDEIAERTGFSWTKVNRSLTEGRKRFFARFGQIESGQRCERFAPLLSAASDGEASGDDQRLLRAHLRSCYACRAVASLRVAGGRDRR
jgi:RNA polymerase sigma factor (sigma-70 family)